jgi:hypothetical protein
LLVGEALANPRRRAHRQRRDDLFIAGVDAHLAGFLAHQQVGHQAIPGLRFDAVVSAVVSSSRWKRARSISASWVT